jgi:hypothetical protein
LVWGRSSDCNTSQLNIRMTTFSANILKFIHTCSAVLERLSGWMVTNTLPVCAHSLHTMNNIMTCNWRMSPRHVKDLLKYPHIIKPQNVQQRVLHLWICGLWHNVLLLVAFEFLWNSRIHLKDYTASKPNRPQSELPTDGASLRLTALCSISPSPMEESSCLLISYKQRGIMDVWI